MRQALKFLIGPAVLLVVMAIVGLSYLRITGLRGQPSPGRLETFMAHTLREFAIPGAAKARTNPLPADENNVGAGMEHYAQYCAMCHGDDGSGQDAPIGRGLYPKPPDLRASETQEMSDGALLWIIINGVRFTGMPAFGTGHETPDEEE